MNLEYHPEVEDDLAEAAAFYESQTPGLGEDFLLQVRRAVDGILAMPERWVRIAGPVRRGLLARFPYVPFYAYDGHRVLILTVVHTSRRPGTWRRRLR